MPPTFLCLGALDECAALNRAKILLTLKEIIRMPPATRVFLNRRPHVEGEVGKHLAVGITLVSVDPRRDDIVPYIQAKLAEVTTSDEMDKGLEAKILRTIPETVAEMRARSAK